MTPSVVDWCEANYVISPWVAEFWNTTSSLPIFFAGLFGAYKWGQGRPELRFMLGFLTIAFVGLGSALFHGSLLRATQALDELPMIYTGLLGVWVLLHRSRPTGEGGVAGMGLIGIGVVFTLAYWLVPAYFEIFLGVYALCIAFIVVRTIQLSIDPLHPPAAARLSRLAAACYLFGFFCLWVPEHVLLGCDHWLQAFHLHSWWHLTSLFGTVAWFRWSVLDRDVALGNYEVMAPEATGAAG